jgi:hypothetical protein
MKFEFPPLDGLSCDKTYDPVDKLVRNLTPEETGAWLVKYHNLPEGSAETVIMNLREQYRWHRLQGRLDKCEPAALFAELLVMRQSPLALKRPENTAS